MTGVDTRAVRASEQLDWGRLSAYLRAELPKRIDGFDAREEMEVEQFPGGHSNLTYLLRFGNREVVMRRPPFGPVPPRAHDMARECRLLAAVHPVFPLAPRPYLLCDDLEVTGFVFYVMERRRGMVIRDDEPRIGRAEARPTSGSNIVGAESGLNMADAPCGTGFSPSLRKQISESVVNTLADLHAVDVAAKGLDSLGKPAGFVARQIRGWTERWQGAKTSDVPEMEQLASWLERRIPPDLPRPALVHGDYKLDNIMLEVQPPHRPVAVLDWEMSAIGDPLVDLGILLCYWVHVAVESRDDAVSAVTARPGWFGRQEILERYADRARRAVDGIAVYEVFAVFKLAVVIQQIYARYVRGQTDDPRFATLGERVFMLARKAASLAEELG